MSTATLRCYMAIACCYLMNVGVGLLSAYPSTALPDIASGHYGFYVGDRSMEAWFASMTRLAGLIACVVVSPLMDTYGRKATVMLFALFNAVGWFISAVAQGSAALWVGNVIVSIAGEAYMVLTYVCVAEITPKEIRGNAMSGNCCSLLVGVALSYVFGTFVNWRWHAVIGLANGFLIAMCSLLFLPETPRYLLVHGLLDNARFNLHRLRRYGSNSKQELMDELSEMEERIRATQPISCFAGLSLLIKAPLRRPFLISQFLIIFQQCSSNGYIKTFTVTIFKMASSGNDAGGGVLNNPHYQTIVIGLCAVIGGITSMSLLDRLGRRPMLIISLSMTVVSLTALGTFFYLHATEPRWTTDNLQWLPLCSLILFELAYGLGLGPIPFVMTSEMFPTRVRSVASAMGTLTFSLALFVVVKVSGSVFAPPYTLFWVYAGISLVGVAFVVTFVPETKGLTLESVEKMWFMRGESYAATTNTNL